jgi:hypothetical protein
MYHNEYGFGERKLKDPQLNVDIDLGSVRECGKCPHS